MHRPNTTTKPRLLILDEDRIIVQSLSQFLRREGYDVTGCDAPDAAMNHLDASPYQLLLADVNMQGIKPVDFLRDLKRRHPHLVVIVITGFGPFEGAIADKMGRFMAADGGTIFLDEINSASPAFQVKLLRVLQERAFEPVGATVTRTVDVRVLLATNVDLAQLVAEQRFRQDLYYRINVVNIKLPYLRERLSDIPLLANHFLRHFTHETGREILGFTDAALAALQRYPWPGNVRELENAVERAVVLCRRPHVDVEDLPETLHVAPTRMSHASSAAEVDDAPPLPLEQALEGPERRIIERPLNRNNWNRQATAAELDINRTTLYKKMRKYRLDVGEAN